jgi:hypothetical protein
MRCDGLPLLFAFAAALAACGGPGEPQSPTGDAAMKGRPASSSTPAAPAGGSAAAAKAESTAAPVAKGPINPPNRVSVKLFVGDDPGKIIEIKSPRAWSLGPGDSWVPSMYDFVRTEGTKNIFREPEGQGEFAVPGAFTMEATPAEGLKKGDPVFVPVDDVALCGLVVDVTKDGVRVAREGDVEAEGPLFRPEEVLRFYRAGRFGDPVAYKSSPDDPYWLRAHLVYMDDTNAWVTGNEKIPVSRVKLLDVTRTYKVGEKVLAAADRGAHLMPATITKVADGGLHYVMKNAESNVATAWYCHIMPIIK